MPGLLDILNDQNNPNRMGLLMGLMGMSQGLLNAGRPSRIPVGFGGALAQGMGGMQQGMMQGLLYQDLAERSQDRRAKRKRADAQREREVAFIGNPNRQTAGAAYPRLSARELLKPAPKRSTSKDVAGFRRYEDTGDRVYPGAVKAPFKPTAAQTASNKEITAARMRLYALKVPKGSTRRAEILRRATRGDDYGFENPDFDQLIAGNLRKATQHLVGPDANYDRFWQSLSEVVEPEPVEPVVTEPTTEPEGAGVIERL